MWLIKSKTTRKFNFHCVLQYLIWNFYRQPQFFSVKSGSNNQHSGGTVFQINHVIIHREYNFTSKLNDLAILKTATDIPFDNNTQPIALVNETIPKGSRVVISGWGQTSANDYETPNILHFTDMIALSNMICSIEKFSFSKSVLCLGHSTGSGACFGDSGGPAVYDGQLAGIGGYFPTECGDTREPDGYTKISYYIDWIQDLMEKEINGAPFHSFLIQ